MMKRLPGIDRQRSVLRCALPAGNTYSPYGMSPVVSVARLAFCGQYCDAPTGSYPLGNGRRFYNPILMRFMTPDALSPFSRGGINGYGYCGADPVNRHDPSGAFWVSILLRAVGLASSGTTLFGATVRTMRNIVGRRVAIEAGTSHQDLPQLSRVSNQQFAMTGVFGVAGQITASAYGVNPTLQTLSDVLAVGNTVTNLSGGSIGNFAAAREVYGYLREHPRQIASVAWETILDLTMVDEMFSAIGRGVEGAARRIRSTRPAAPHDVQV